MNVLKMMGLDSNILYGVTLILIGVFFFVFAYVYWKRNEAWKRNKGEKTKFLTIWKPSTLFGCFTFILLGVGFIVYDKLMMK